MTIVETSRLRLREFRVSDLETLAAMVADDEQMRFYPRPKTKDEASAWIDRNLTLYEEAGFGFWLMESTVTGRFLGYCGIRPLKVEGVDEIEMGWHTTKQVWGQGIATEGARACRDLAFDRFGLQRLIATIGPENIPSRRVVEKIRMEPERDTVLDGYPCIIYALAHTSI